MAKWTEDELALLRDGVGMIAWADMAIAFDRTKRAVRAKARRLGLLKPTDTYAPGELAHMLGVSTGTVEAWRRQGLLKGYARRHVRQFLWHHADVLGTGRVDLVWLVDVLTSGKSGRAA